MRDSTSHPQTLILNPPNPAPFPHFKGTCESTKALSKTNLVMLGVMVAAHRSQGSQTM